MQKVKITFLGTGNAVPSKQRNHTGILLSYKDENLLFDCGENIQRQFRFTDISITKITKIFITHWHGDHILGLPGLFQTLAMSNYSKKLKIYGPPGTVKFVSLITQLLKGIRIDVQAIEVKPGIVFDSKEFLIEAETMTHGIPALAYSFQIKDKLRIDKKKLKKFKVPSSSLLSKLSEGQDIIINNKKIRSQAVCYKEKGKKVTIILDTALNDNMEKIAKNADILICESTFSDKEADKAKEYKHLTSKQAADTAKKAKVKRLILTHISQRYENNLKEIEKEAKKVFKNTLVAKDLDSITL